VATAWDFAKTRGSAKSDCTGGNRTMGELTTIGNSAVGATTATLRGDDVAFGPRFAAQPNMAAEAANRIVPVDADQTRNNSLPRA